MSKGMRNTLVVIAIVLLIFIILFVVYKNNKTEPMDANASQENILDDANTGLENMLNDIFDNVETENTVVENKVENTVTNNENVNTNTNTNTDNKSEAVNDDTKTPKETKAINLVKEAWKEKWGKTDDVSFNVSIQSDGKYGVTVYDVTTTQSIKFYIVDVDTGIIKER